MFWHAQQTANSSTVSNSRYCDRSLSNSNLEEGVFGAESDSSQEYVQARVRSRCVDSCEEASDTRENGRSGEVAIERAKGKRRECASRYMLLVYADRMTNPSSCSELFTDSFSTISQSEVSAAADDAALFAFVAGAT